METIDILLKSECYIMDFLPERVERDNGGQFFQVEEYLLRSDRYVGLKDRFMAVILKLMCYYHMAIWQNGWIDRPSPEMLEKVVCEMTDDGSGTLNILFVEEDTLLVFDRDSSNLAVYNPSEKAQVLMEKIASSEGLFWRRAEN